MSPSVGNDLQTNIALLQAELSRLRDSSGEAWRSYLMWFTWYFTLQVGAISWVVTKDPKPWPLADIAALAAVFITFNVLGIVAGMRQLAYCSLQRRRADQICAQLTARAESNGLSVEITSGFASDLVHSTLIIFCVALFSGSVSWLYLIVRSLR
jgi:hypothetical protein